MDLQHFRDETLDLSLAAKLAPFIRATRPHDRPYTRSELKDNNNLGRSLPRTSQVGYSGIVFQSKRFHTTWLPDLEEETV